MDSRAILCWLAQRASEAWDFIDKRDIDKHVITWTVLVMTWEVAKWAMAYADESSDNNIALNIAAVTAPVAGLATFVMKWQFERCGSRGAGNDRA